jgi:hypothetical protein
LQNDICHVDYVEEPINKYLNGGVKGRKEVMAVPAESGIHHGGASRQGRPTRRHRTCDVRPRGGRVGVAGPWINNLSDGLSVKEIETVVAL